MAKLISTTTMILQNLFLVKNKGSKNRLCAQGRAGQAQHFFSGRRISQSEIRNSAAKKSESESEGGQKFLPPNPLPFCPPEHSVSAVPPAAGAISRSFVQNRFELRSAIATFIACLWPDCSIYRICLPIGRPLRCLFSLQ